MCTLQKLLLLFLQLVLFSLDLSQPECCFFFFFVSATSTVILRVQEKVPLLFILLGLWAIYHICLTALKQVQF